MMGWRRPTNRCTLALQNFLKKNPCERTWGIVASAGAVTSCTNTHLDQMSRFDLNSSRTAFTDACLAASDTFVSLRCLVDSKRFVPCVVDCALTASPSSRQRSPQCGGNWHIDDLFCDALRHAPLGGRLCSPLGPLFTPHTLNQRFFLASEHTNMHCGVMWRNLVFSKIGRDVSRCHRTPPPNLGTFSP